MADKEELDLHKDNPGRAWYVIHTYSGYENKVKANLERLIHTANMEDMIFGVVVPMEDEVEIKDGHEKVVPRKVFPGYVLVDMVVDERSWYVVRNTTGVTGFVGSEKHPIPLTPAEAQRILQGGITEREKAAPEVAVGDAVRIKAGVFENYEGTISEIDTEKARLKVIVDGTPVEMGFREVERI
ncbi:transcription termination/antitermination protein NusG [Mitsuokella sp. oral taxon 131]|uniref:transcription termination/antitermination protein NusG n=1 Tax=Mitsuokella sp. oral taxon 131 TaxID=1321780 RepID=UPI0003AE1CA3|nr:transcription termination/antitermination protein NusG [Mitsuokella sp. oral taxon 131]ERL03381.1 transcription termination/antitermination factor NusG [Mitsuokella sp. oral taxon 131 str. W9106]